jgi:hypothetical protein
MNIFEMFNAIDICSKASTVSEEFGPIIEETIDGYKTERRSNPFGYGWGNGYVVIPSTHPLFKENVDYDSFDELNVHGGVTYYNYIKNSDGVCEGLKIGFDTSHYGDNSSNCSEQYVINEIKSLVEQLKKFATEK